MDDIKLESMVQGLTGRIMHVLDKEKVGLLNQKAWDRIEDLIRATIQEALNAKTTQNKV